MDSRSAQFRCESRRGSRVWRRIRKSYRCTVVELGPSIEQLAVQRTFRYRRCDGDGTRPTRLDTSSWMGRSSRPGFISVLADTPSTSEGQIAMNAVSVLILAENMRSVDRDPPSVGKGSKDIREADNALAPYLGVLHFRVMMIFLAARLRIKPRGYDEHQPLSETMFSLCSFRDIEINGNGNGLMGNAPTLAV